MKNNVLDNIRESIPGCKVYRRRDRLSNREIPERYFSE